jgi:hypothetical protein
VNNNFAIKRRELQEELATLDRRRDVILGKLALLDELDKDEPSSASRILRAPSISITDAFRQGMRALGQFTKNDVVTWARSQYPLLDFSPKSFQRPLRDMMESGEVVKLKESIGSKAQAVYGLTNRNSKPTKAPTAN